MTAEDVFLKYLTEIGITSPDQLTSTSYDVSCVLASGHTSEWTDFRDTPDKFRRGTDEFATVFDGINRKVGSDVKKNISEDMLYNYKLQAAVLDEIFFLKHLNQCKYDGRKNLNGEYCHVISANRYKNEYCPRTLYYSERTGLKLRGENYDYCELFEDYEEFSTIRFPAKYAIKFHLGGQDVYTYSNIKVNPVLDPALFVIS